MATEKLDLKLPEKGAKDWHIPLNENFKAIDDAVILQVPTVDDLKENFTPSDETFAFIEQSRQFWSGTGSEWVQVGYIKQTPNDIYVQSSEPKDAVEGDVWIEP